MTTKYRTVSNGYWNWLEYQDHSFNWLGFRIKKWKRVPKPYYDKIWGRSLGDVSDTATDSWVNSLDDNIENFVKANPDIFDYLVKTWAYIAKAEQQAYERRQAIAQSNGEINYLN